MNNEEAEKIIREVIAENPQLEMYDVIVNKISHANQKCIVANLSYTWVFNGWDKQVTRDRWFVQENNHWRTLL